jgi:FkbM family methyltransferase
VHGNDSGHVLSIGPAEAGSQFKGSWQMKLAKRFMTVVRQPAVGAEYLSWLMQLRLLRQQPTRLVRNLVRIGSFANFSEYHSAPDSVNDDEWMFLMNYALGEGQIIDVGANIGLVTLVLAKRYPNRVVHAIEPNPFTYSALVSNVALNGLKNVHCHEMAIAERTGTVLFNANPQRANAAIAQVRERHTKSVASRTLDDFLIQGRIGNVSLLKVDVEGYEASIFRGASRTLSEIRPLVVYFEVCPVVAERLGFNPVEPAQILLEHGYTLTRLAAGGILAPARLKDIPTVVLENWIAVPSRARGN